MSIKLTVGNNNTIVKKITVGVPVGRFAAVSTVSLDGLSDVSAGSPQNGQFIAYDSATSAYLLNNFSDSTPRQAIRSLFSAGGDLSYDSATGQFSFDVEQVYTKDNFDSDFNLAIDEAVLGGYGIRYDSATNTLHIDSGELADYFLKAVSGDIIPSVDSTYDLGSPTFKWKDLYLSGGTIYLGGLLVKDVTGTFTVTDSAGVVSPFDLSGNTTTDLAEGNNLYYTRARFDSALGDNISSNTIRSYLSAGTGVHYDSNTGQFSIGQPVETSSNVTFATVTATSDVLIGGNLTVNGTTTTINSTTLSVNDKNIVLADSAPDAVAANGAGITVAGADATITYNSTDDDWVLNKGVQAPDFEGVYLGFDSDLARSTSISTIRGYINLVDAGGDGSLTYDSASGKFTYTGPSAAEVRAHFSAAGDLTYDSATGVFSFDVEQVYTKANFDSDLNLALSTDAVTTTDLTEGDNLYYTRARFDSALGDATSTSTIRGYVSAVDNGGDGSFSYNSSTGEFTYTGPSATEVRSHFSAAGDLSYDSSTGQFSFDVEAVYTKDNFDSDFNVAIDEAALGGVGLAYDAATNTLSIDSAELASYFSTDNITEGSNLYYTRARFDSALGDATSTSTIRSYINAGTGVHYDSATGQVSIGQPVETTSNVTFATVTTTSDVLVGGNLTVNGTTTTINSTTLSVNDKNIVLADSAADSTAANGAGITVAGANATITYQATPDDWVFNKGIQAIDFEGVYLGFDSDLARATTISTIRSYLNVVDAGGDGSFTYDSALGKLTYTGPSAAEVRAHFSAAGDLTYDSATGVFSFDVETVYTKANFDSDLNLALSTDAVTTTDLTEGDNLYYTTARADSDAKNAVSAIDAGGDGSFSYDNTTGVFTYTGPSAAEIRAHFSAAGDLSYDSATGQFSFDVEAVYTKANFDSDLNLALSTDAVTTTDLTEGDNLYYTTARADSDAKNAISVTDVGGDGSLSYNPGTGVLTYTGPSAAEVRSHFSAAGDLSYDSSTGQFSFDVEAVYTKANFDSDFNQALDEATLGGVGLTYNASTNTLSIDSAELSAYYTQTIRGYFSASGDLVYDSATGQFSFDVEQVYTKANFDSDLNLALSTDAVTTTDLTEGDNLYYTTARADSDFDARLATKSTTDLVEGNNLYYTTARADSDAKNAVSVTDAGGDGSLTYDAGTGVFTYTGPSATEVRAHLVAGTGVSYDSASGVIAIGQAVGIADSVVFASVTTTGNVVIGGNLQVNGTTVTVNSTDLNVTDNMIYMNAGESSGSPTASIDVGWAANVNDQGSYEHVGLFRDATDQTFKVFQGYTPEPDAAVQINTGHASFSLAPFQASTLTGVYLGFDSDFNVKAPTTNVSTFINDANYLDSTTVQGVINSAYVNGLIDSVDNATYAANAGRLNDQAPSYYLDYNNFTNTPTNVSTFVNDANYLDSTTVQGVIDASYIQSNQITYNTSDFTDSAFVTGLPVSTFTNDANYLDSTTVAGVIDSAYIEARRPAETIFAVVNNGASAYTFTGDGFPSTSDNPTLYLARGKTYKFGVNASGHPFQIRVSSGGAAYSDGVTNNGAQVGDVIFTVPMNAPKTLVYQCTIHSGMVGNIIIFNEDSFLDSSTVTGVINSAYIQANQITYNTSDFTDSAFVTGLPVSTFTNDANYLDSTTVQGVIDAAYIQANQTTYLDSYYTTALIDSAYVQARQTVATTNPIFKTIKVTGQSDIVADSATDILNIAAGSGISITTDAGTDTLTITATGGGGGGGTDSATVISLIQSTIDSIGAISGVETVGANTPSDGQALVWNNSGGYWEPGNVASSGGETTGTFNRVSVNTYTGDSSTTAFTLSAAPASESKNSVIITINGIVQHINTYSLSGAVVTLDSAPLSGDDIEMRVHDDITSNIQLRDYKSYVYTPSTATSSFSGVDDNGSTLTYDQGKVEVYLNGSRLVNTLDYTATTGTTVVLGSAIDSGDTLEIVSLAKASLVDFGVTPHDSDFSTAAANQILHTFDKTIYRTAKYLVQVEHDSDSKYHAEEILLTHNGTTVAMTSYAQVYLDSSLGTFDADISGGYVRLLFSPVYTNTSVKLRTIRVSA